MTSSSDAASAGWDPSEIISLILICVLLPVVIIGNMMVILAVVRFRRLQIPTNMFIVSLSVSDILSGLFSPFLLIIELNKETISNAYLCVAPYCGVLMGISVSIMTLASIAFDRYTACVFPMEYVYVITARRIAAILFATWILGVTLTWVMILSMTAQDQPALPACTLNAVNQNSLIVLLTVVFLPCGVFIFFCYFKICVVARHHVNAINAVERSVQTDRQLRHFRRDTKYAKTLGFVITGFLLLSLPLEISIMVKVASGLDLDDRVLSVCVLLALLNGALNPWIYAFRNSEFRAAFRTILKETANVKILDSPQKSPTSKSDSTLNGEGGKEVVVRCDSRLGGNGVHTVVNDVYSQKAPSSAASSAMSGNATPVEF